MSRFNRQFDVDRAEKALDSPENIWFRDLLTHWRPGGALGTPHTAPGAPADHLRLAVRNGYLNFYRSGQSVAKVTLVNDRLQCEIHNKYVSGDGGGGKEYVRITDGKYKGQDGSRVPYRDNLLREWILNANEYTDDEKRFVDGVVGHEAGAIDLEAALPADLELWAEKSAPRMDLVTIEPCGDHCRLVFWEAKLVTNSEARCRDSAVAPKVIAQLAKYEKWITKNRKVVCQAYQRCCKDMVRLHEIAKRLRPEMPELGKDVVAVAQGASPLCVDSTPRLIIAIDGTRGDASFTQNGHLKKLQEFGICVQMVRTGIGLSAGV